MLSYKQWKTLNESILPSFNLGIANPSNLGLQAPAGFGFEEARMSKKTKKKMSDEEDEDEDEDEDEKDAETGDGEVVDKKDAPPKNKPDVDVEDDEDDDEDAEDDEDNEDDEEKGEKCKKCGMYCKNKCGSYAKKKSKKKMSADNDEDDKDEDEDKCPDCGKEECTCDDECPECGEDKEDCTCDDDGKKTKIKIGGKGGLSTDSDADQQNIKNAKKKSKKKMHAESADEESWWNSVHNMLGTTDEKFSDGVEGLFTPVDTENLTQAVRDESEAGQPGFAPSQKIGGVRGSFFG